MRRLGMAAVAVALVPALLAAQTDSSRMRDSSRRSGRQQQTSSGSVSSNTSTRSGARLSHDQVTQLQTALQNAGCDPGTIDGVMGSHTRKAMNCARQKNNITGNDPNALYQSLNLNFSASDTGAANGTRSRGNRNASTSATGASGSMTNGTSGATGSARRTRGSRTRGTAGDSTRRTTTGRPDSTRRP